MKYFAFISYSHEDLRAARFIQGELEHFRHANLKVREELRPSDANFVREIYLDRTGLSGRSVGFEKELEKALAESRYLIVICSPEAVSKKDGRDWIQWEIETFKRLHGEGADAQIIPVISSGNPDLTDESCLPLPVRRELFASRNLPDMRVHDVRGGFWARRKAWHSAVITLLSYVFDVERQAIEDRFAVERARVRLRMLTGLTVAIAVIAVFGVWAYLERERKKDAEAWQCYDRAVRMMDDDGRDVFGGTGAALDLLVNARRLPAAREFFSWQFPQRNWILPVRREPRAMAMTNEVCDTNVLLCDGRVKNRKIFAPGDFPIVYENGTNVWHHLIAYCKGNTSRPLWKSSDSVHLLYGLVSPVGNVLVLMEERALVALDPFTGEKLWRKRMKNLSIYGKMAFSPDGRYLVVVSRFGLISILEPETGKRLYETLFAGPTARSVRFSDDSKELMVDTGTTNVVCRLLPFSLERGLSIGNQPIVGCEIATNAFSLVARSSMALHYGTGGLKAVFDATSGERQCIVEGADKDVEADKRFFRTNMKEQKHGLSCSNQSFIVQSLDNAVVLRETSKRTPKCVCQMPARIQAMSFFERGRENYLLLAGALLLPSRDSMEGFYSIIDADSGQQMLFHENLNEGISEIHRVSSDFLLFHGDGNTRDWLVRIPQPCTEEELKQCCEILRGQRLGAEFPLQLRCGLREEPLDCELYFSKWEKKCKEIVGRHYRAAHFADSAESVEQHLRKLKPEWQQEVSDDEGALYFANRMTKLWNERHPLSSRALRARKRFLQLRGKDATGDLLSHENLLSMLRNAVTDRSDIYSDESELFESDIVKLVCDVCASSLSRADALPEVVSNVTLVLEKELTQDFLTEERLQSLLSAIDAIDSLRRCDRRFHAYAEKMVDDLILSASRIRPKEYSLQTEETLRAFKFLLALGDNDHSAAEKELASVHGNLRTFAIIWLDVVLGKSMAAKEQYQRIIGNSRSPLGDEKLAFSCLRGMKCDGVDLGEMDAVYSELCDKYWHGVKIRTVAKNSEAECQGLRVGDSVVEIDGIPIDERLELQVALAVRYYTPSEKESVFVVLRNGRRVSVHMRAKHLGIGY